MNIRSRILLLLSFLIAAFVIWVMIWQTLASREAAIQAQDTSREKAVFFEKLLTLKASSLGALASDYTYWDEMVNCIRTHNIPWAKQNLDTCLSTYDADGIWVFDTQMTSVYSVCGKDIVDLKRFPLSPLLLSKTLAHSHFCHFFIKTQEGILEVRGATVHLSNDEQRTGPVFGYFFTARLWDQDYLHTLADLTESQVTLQRDISPLRSVKISQDFVTYGQDLPGWDTKPISQLWVVSQNKSAVLHRQSEKRLLYGVMFFACVVILVLSVSLLRWVSAPLRLIAQALEQHRPQTLYKLQTEATEFGELARLIDMFFNQKEALKSANTGLELRVQERTVELEEANREIAEAYDATIEGWSHALDLRDKETEGHCQRVTRMTVKLARALDIPHAELEQIRRGALLHDIGKMGVPDQILLKPGPLTDEEWVLMRRHPQYAYEMLEPIAFLRSALDIPYCHHEKWDGTGYPRGLRGEDIPLSARMFAIVDVWDALCSDRPYREAWPLDRVCEHLISLSGTHFDPCVVDVFIKLAFSGQTEGFLKAA